MGSDLLQRGQPGGIFFHQIFHRTHGHPAILEGEEKGVLVAIHGEYLLPLLQIVQKGCLHLLAKIDHSLISPFPADFNPTDIKVHILQIQAHAL